MTPRTPPKDEPETDLEAEELTVRDRTYESFGEQGLALPTYGHAPDDQQGEEDVELGEEVAPPLPSVRMRAAANVSRDTPSPPRSEPGRR